MPNWCNNTLKINGHPQEIALLNWQDNELFFAPFLPKLDDTHEDSWGCKWDCPVQLIQRTEDYLEIELETPWNPPLIGIQKLSTLFPRCLFELRYSESGCDFQGQAIFKSGREIEHLQNSFYGEERTCSECHKLYRPGIDLVDSTIIDDYCYHCGSEFFLFN